MVGKFLYNIVSFTTVIYKTFLKYFNYRPRRKVLVRLLKVVLKRLLLKAVLLVQSVTFQTFWPILAFINGEESVLVTTILYFLPSL